MIFGVDIGLSGGISNGHFHAPMPVKKIETKPAVLVLDKDSKGNKQFYSTGPKKGTVKYRIKSPAKTKAVLDVFELSRFFQPANTIVLEAQGTTYGNSAKSTRTTSINFGKLLAVAELSGAKVITVPPHIWKRDLKLSKDKLESVVMAEQLTGESFRTGRGALLDGKAEAFLIWHWFTTKGESNDS